ncbi:MAG: hypothetical protein HC840_01450 [Leptolyngbyaceae cyanobacterium RM2_2_4]|nr:hypothetical protein [Leptolyngbyaceae cyanobacterium SM1_4_3]NJO48361.1 hypothetical protein [Leptolyngbyaceae cyanobacterium RM2_2_4]
MTIDEEALKSATAMIQQGRQYMQAGSLASTVRSRSLSKDAPEISPESAVQYQQAVAMFTQAISIYPDSAEAYMGRAYCKSFLKMDCNDVIEDFQNAESAYRRREQTNEANNISRLIKEYMNKMGIQ